LNRILVPEGGLVSKTDRQRLNGHRSAILWFTGLPSSGKSTLARRLEERLFQRGIRTFVLDGDNIRMGLNRDLGFTEEGRQENIRRIGEVAKLFVEAGVMVMTAFISPYRRDRAFVRTLVEKKEFIEIYVKCPLVVCEHRDVKGLYRLTRQGLIKNFTGLNDPYEKPEHPEYIVDTDRMAVEESVEGIMAYLEKEGYFTE
jgi:adenylylsulfate kinase